MLSEVRPLAGLQFDIPSLTMISILFASFVQELRGDSRLFPIGSFDLHASDITVGFLVVALSMSAIRLGRMNGIFIIIAAIMLLALANVFRGVLVDPFSTFFAFRSPAILFLSLLYVAISPPGTVSIQKLMPWLVIFSGAIGAIFLARLFLGPTAFLLTDTLAYQNIIDLELRALNAESVLILGFVSVFSLFRLVSESCAERRRFYFYLLLGTATIILLSRQRTAALASFLGWGTVLISNPVFLRKYSLLAIFFALMGFLAGFIWAFGLLPDLVAMLPGSFQESLFKTQTFSGRQRIWTYAIEGQYLNWDIVKQLFGAPMGERIVILTVQGVWAYSLHSQYIALLMYYGAVGGILWALLIFATIVSSVGSIGRQSANNVGLPPSIVLGWLAMLLIYGITYEWRLTTALIFAITVAGNSHAYFVIGNRRRLRK